MPRYKSKIIALFFCFSVLLLATIPQIRASELSAKQQSINLLTNVIGIDLTKYKVDIVADTIDQPAGYGGLTTEAITINLEANTSKVQAAFIFTSNTLTYCVVSPLKGSIIYIHPFSADTLAKSKQLLQRYQQYSGATNLQDARNILNTVTEMRSTTKTEGNLSVQLVSNDNITDINWKQTVDDINFPTGLSIQIKGEGIGISDISSFSRIGNAKVLVSEEAAVQIALESARTLTLRVTQDDGAYKDVPVSLRKEPLTVSLEVGKREPFTQYPLWYVFFAFDKPVGGASGAQVGIWADTGEIAYCQTAGHSGGFVADEIQQAYSQSQTRDEGNQQMQIASNSQLITVFAIIAMAAIYSTTVLKKKSLKPIKHHIHKVIVPILLCLLIFSFVASAKGAVHVGAVWGTDTPSSQSDPSEDQVREDTCQYVAGVINDRVDWECGDYYGVQTTRSNILGVSYVVQSDSNYDILATFHVGDFSRPYPNIWHEGYLTDKNDYQKNITDYQIYSYAGAKHYFTFMWVCTLADMVDINDDGILDAAYGYYNSTEGQIVGMPYAWTHTLSMDLDGYASPDSGDYCYISFQNVSRKLKETAEFFPHNYGDFVERFYHYAYVHQLSINNALDMATNDMGNSSEPFFGDSLLYNGYSVWVEEEGMPPGWYPSWMHVFGNGDMVLPFSESPAGPHVTVLARDQNGDCIGNPVYISIDGYQVGQADGIYEVSSGMHSFGVTDPSNGYFQNFTYSSGSNASNPMSLLVSSDITITAYFTVPYHWLTVYAHDQAPDNVPTSVSIDYGAWTGMAGEPILVPAGWHYVAVDGTVWGEYGEEWWFYYFDGYGLTENPVWVNVGSDTELTAIYWRVAK